MKKILITGGAGFLGSHLARALLEDGNEVAVMDNLFTGNKSNIYALEREPRFTFILQDVTQPFWGQFDEIYNLACPASPVHYQRNPVETIRTSLLGMMHVLDLAQRTRARVLHASTSEVYGDPLEHPQRENYWGHVNVLGVRSCYDEGKRCAETLCADYHRQYGVDVRLIRIFNTYGPHMHPLDGRVISNFIVQALSNRDITIYGSGDQTRSFQYVDDLIRGMKSYMAKDVETLRAWFAQKGYAVPVLNVGNPGEFTIKELAEKVLRGIPESKSKLIYQPLPCDDPRQRRPDITFARELLGWEPHVSLDEGLERTIAWFRERQLKA
jgi:UDP-glucuronate decarboxylase